MTRGGGLRPVYTRVVLRSDFRAVVLALSLGITACGFKESFEDTNRTVSALKTELGIHANVSFRTTNGRTVVSVHLAKPPAGDAAAAKTKITDVVNRNFRTKVERVDVSF
jgi:hypothetical protein